MNFTPMIFLENMLSENIIGSLKIATSDNQELIIHHMMQITSSHNSPKTKPIYYHPRHNEKLIRGYTQKMSNVVYNAISQLKSSRSGSLSYAWALATPPQAHCFGEIGMVGKWKKEASDIYTWYWLPYIVARLIIVRSKAEGRKKTLLEMRKVIGFSNAFLDMGSNFSLYYYHDLF